LWIGWTENYARVEFPAEAALVQAPARVRLEEISPNGETILASFVEAGATAASPARYIPLLV
jgi:hypothetical protein